MSKKTKATKPSTEDGKERAGAASEQLSTAKAELKTFREENKIKKTDTPETVKDKKVAKQFGVLLKAVEKAEAAVTKLGSGKKAKKEKGERAPRASKYDYPEGMSADEKKKYRTAMRNGKEYGAAASPKGAKKKAGKEAPAATTEAAIGKKKKKAKKSQAED